MGLDDDVPADLGIPAEKHRLGRDERRAVRHRRIAQPALHDGFGRGELGARIHAEDLAFIGRDHARLEPLGMGERHGVGEIEFLLGVVVADPPEEIEQGPARAKTHDPGIAKLERPLGLACILLLANSDEPSPFIEKEPAIARRVLGLEADDGEIGARLERGANFADRLGAQERRIAVKDQNLTGERLDGVPRSLDGIGRAALILLNEDFEVRVEIDGGRSHVVHARPDNDRKPVEPGIFRRQQRVKQKRRAGEWLQHLGPLRLHARAFAGRKNDGESRAVRHAVGVVTGGASGIEPRTMPRKAETEGNTWGRKSCLLGARKVWDPHAGQSRSV